MLRFAIFVLFFFGANLFFDFYTLRQWSKFVRQNGWSKYLSQIPWAMGGIFTILFLYTSYLRLDHIPGPEGITKAIQIAVALWYFPKLPIAIVLIGKNIILWIKRRRSKTSAATEISEARKAAKLNRARIGWSLALLPFLFGIYGLFNNTYDFELTEQIIPIYKLPQELDGLTIVHISDIHSGSYYSTEVLAGPVALINQMKPDLIVITGDFVNFHQSELRHARPYLKALKAKYGVWGCLGNHDHYMSIEEHQALIDELEEIGIDLLINENTTIDIMGQKLQLAGADSRNLHKHSFGDIDKTMAGADPSLPTVLLWHDPINWDPYVLRNKWVDLTLAGHTHGGQIGFDFDWLNLTLGHLVYGKVAGLFREKDQYMYINRGMGLTALPLRIGVRPEITLITLKAIPNIAAVTY